MANSACTMLCFFSSILMFSMICTCTASDDDRKVHIVYMGSLPKRDYSPSSHHLNLLQEVVASSSTENLLVRSYKRSFNGFAAKLTDNEAQKLAGKEEVVSVFPSRTLQLHTTRSWDFTGLNETVPRRPTIESDVIIGVIDSGIWPESASFSDEGFGPPPKKWKGGCHGGQNFTCNNKLIGARYYGDGGSFFARDNVGHGTHTASTAAGNKVKDASFYGLAQGTAKGGVPSARIAAYKVCDTFECSDSAILAAFDDAIADGVDIITLSIGFLNPVDLFDDSIAIGSFHAMAKGILTTHSAGNDGPTDGSVTSVAPWLFTAAASTTDRKFIDRVVLGNGKTIIGRSVNSFNHNGQKFPLIYGDKLSSLCTAEDAKSCGFGCLNSSLVKGKIILCNDFRNIDQANEASAAGSILLSDQFYDVSFVVPLPSSVLVNRDFDVVTSYENSTKNPVASILKSEVVEDVIAPKVATFSSRGPNTIVADIMKPDITGPGVEILASYPTNLAPTVFPEDRRRVKFNVMSGTSMSCPHLAGAAAYVKSFQPSWSPSIIKSALMTTAWPMNYTTGNAQDREFAYGSGHINPSRAIHPGLVYPAKEEDYITLLCSLGYDTDKVRKISSRYNSTCSPEARKAKARDFNYPSMTSKVDRSNPFSIEFRRTVKNVGLPNSTYRAEITSLTSGIQKITVVPEVLSFKSLNEKREFNVTVVGQFKDSFRMYASLVWSDGRHTVRSPIIVYH